jgi:nitrogen fixation protein NifQ
MVKGVPLVEGLLAAIHARLMAASSGLPGDTVIARMYATWATGGGALPDWWGLSPVAFRALLQCYFPYYEPDPVPNPGRVVDAAREPECIELQQLLMEGCPPDAPALQALARVVAVACLGSNHLWQDLGVWSRDDLGELLYRHFPVTARRNTADMKWKKFLYKQLCQADGIHTCRAPSCEVCVDYAACFGPEH